MRCRTIGCPCAQFSPAALKFRKWFSQFNPRFSSSFHSGRPQFQLKFSLAPTPILAQYYPQTNLLVSVSYLGLRPVQRVCTVGGRCRFSSRFHSDRRAGICLHSGLWLIKESTYCWWKALSNILRSHSDCYCAQIASVLLKCTSSSFFCKLQTAMQQFVLCCNFLIASSR